MLQVKEFFDKQTSTLTYVVWDEQSRDAAAIDPVLDYDSATSKTKETSVLEVVSFIREKKLNLHFILETHAHADHLSAAQAMKREFKTARIGIGARIKEVQSTFKPIFDMPAGFKTDGSQFDALFEDRQKVRAGSLEFEVIFTPGHTPACASYFFGRELIFTGDALFMPDYGTGRCDFPGASAETLYESIHEKLYSLADEVKGYTGHDYQPGGRELRFMATIGEQKVSNVHLKTETPKNDFVKFRTERDSTLNAPKLLLPSIQVNIDAGRLPSANSHGDRFLKIPIS
ncbi:MAG: MBL fold metallo-hydrolase [Bdellovibrionota bacterium]